MKRFNYLIFFCFCNLSVFSQYSTFDSSSHAQIEEYINFHKEDQKMVGVSVGIIKDGELAYLKGFGYSDRENNIEATEYSLYRTASVAKPITGLMAMKLKAKELLDLEADIRDYLPEYPAKREGTIKSKHLLSNQSGVIHYSGTANGQFCSEDYNWLARDNYIANHRDHYDPIDAIEIFKDQQICFKPGDHHQYTTWGFCLMGAVIERASGSTYEQTLFNEIIEPLGLPFLQPELQKYRPYENEVKGYEFDNQGNAVSTPSSYTDYKDISYKVPGGGLIGSVIDLSLLIKGIVNRELLNEEELKEWSQQRIPDDGDNPYYGYGISSGNRNGNTLLSHSGSQAQTATLIYFSPDNKNGLVIMSNTTGVSLWNLARNIYDYLPNANCTASEFELPCRNILNIPGSNPTEIPNNGIDDDCDGQIDETTSVHNIANTEIVIYPNPVSETLHVEQNGITDFEINLYNLEGKLILTEKNKSKIAVDHLKDGSYILEFIDTLSDKKIIDKIVVSH